MSKKKVKVNIIGIDGGELQVFSWMILSGCMPNMKSILDQAYTTTLDCYVDGPGQGWASFMTGKSPRKHGIFYWKVYQGVSSNDIKEKCIWDILGEYGISCGILNLSYTFPPKPINGFMISGMGGGVVPSEDVIYTYPESLISELKDRAKGYVWGIKRVPGGISIQKRYLEKLIDITEKRGEAYIYLKKNKNPDFFLGVFRGADAIQHSFWHLLNPANNNPKEFSDLTKLIRQYYKILDYYIGKLWEFDEDAFNFIISDHGFGPSKLVININEYLAREKLLFKKKNIKSLIYDIFVHSARSFYLKLYRNYLGKFKVGRSIEKYRKKRLSKIDMIIDWNKTLVYAKCPYGLFFNKRLLNTEQKKEAVFQMVKEKLLSLCFDETGEKIFKKIYRKKDLDVKHHYDSVPDIIFELSDEAFLISPEIRINKRSKIFEDPRSADLGMSVGWHRRYGILISSQKPQNDKLFYEDAKITDVFATVLSIFGIPIPDDIDGRAFL